MTTNKIRIGTRDSQLAIWQANQVHAFLAERQIDSELVFVKSHGEADLQTPLYEMGVTGIFTKTLDMAVLNEQVDLAVHSLKDVPTRLAKGLRIIAIPERASPYDLLIHKGKIPTADEPFKLATGSLRRKAQWLNRFPSHRIESLRGNVNTRLSKLHDSKDLQATILAEAGLNRLQLAVQYSIKLAWMLPAPGQGALAVVAKEEREDLQHVCQAFNHSETEIAVKMERQFLRTLQGGCSTPIGGHALVQGSKIRFKGNVLSLDGSQRCDIEWESSIDDSAAGKEAAEKLLSGGGQKILEQFKAWHS